MKFKVTCFIHWLLSATSKTSADQSLIGGVKLQCLCHWFTSGLAIDISFDIIDFFFFFQISLALARLVRNIEWGSHYHDGEKKPLARQFTPYELLSSGCVSAFNLRSDTLIQLHTIHIHDSHYCG